MKINTVQLCEGGGYIVNGGEIIVPCVPGNKMYQLILNWIDRGNTPGPASVPTTEQLAGQLNADLQAYIYGKYDVGTQMSLNALYNDPSTPQSAKTLIQAYWDWIRFEVMTYYYAKKQAILHGDTSVSWNFDQFDATDPNVSLAVLLAGE